MSSVRELLLSIVEEEMAWSKVPGVTMAFVNGDSTEYITKGFRDRENALPVDEKTLFVIASCSKSMTAAMLGCLVDRGILNWDEPVTTYCPEMKMMDPAAAGMTLRDMLYHRTGLANHDGMWPDVTGRDVLASRLRYLEPYLGFREKFSYNNVIYALTAYVAECASGKSYDALMKECIFDPLGMSSTVTRFDDFIGSGNFAEPYYGRENGPVRLWRWNMDTAVAAAAIATNAADMAKWLRFNISGGLNEKGERVLSEDSWNQIHSGGIERSGEYPKDFMKYDKYGFGWIDGTYRGYRICSHSGKINGYSSFEVFIPELNAGIFTALNIHCPENHLMSRASYSMFDKLIGVCDDGSEWKNVIRKEGDDINKAYYALDLNYLPERPAEPSPARADLEAYTGEYFDNAYGPLRITLEDGKLVAYHRNCRNVLEHYDGDTFFADEFWEDILIIKMPFKFVMPGFGTKALEVVLPMEKTVKETHFVRVL